MTDQPPSYDLPAVPKHTRLTGHPRATFTATAAARYRAGDSIRGLAAASGRSYGFIHRLLVDAGVQLRPRGSRVSR